MCLDVLFVLAFYVRVIIGAWRGNRAERRPPPGIEAQHPAPAPHASHARHDRLKARWHLDLSVVDQLSLCSSSLTKIKCL